MDVIKHNGSLYDIVDIINFSGSYHLIIKGKEVLYINKENDHYYIPRQDLSIKNNTDKDIIYLRKQHLLKCLIDFINNNHISDINKIRYATYAFKEYIKDSDIEAFLYWPLMNHQEFISELDYEINKLDNYLEEKVLNKHLALDGKTMVIDDYKENKKEVEEYVTDPSYKAK